MIHLARAEKCDDFREIADEAEAQGWAVEQTRKGHWRFKPPDGGDMVVFSGSPGDWRALKNFVARMRRSGLRRGRGRNRKRRR